VRHCYLCVFPRTLFPTILTDTVTALVKIHHMLKRVPFTGHGQAVSTFPSTAKCIYCSLQIYTAMLSQRRSYLQDRSPRLMVSHLPNYCRNTFPLPEQCVGTITVGTCFLIRCYLLSDLPSSMTSNPKRSNCESSPPRENCILYSKPNLR